MLSTQSRLSTCTLTPYYSASDFGFVAFSGPSRPLWFHIWTAFKQRPSALRRTSHYPEPRQGEGHSRIHLLCITHSSQLSW